MDASTALMSWNLSEFSHCVGLSTRKWTASYKARKPETVENGEVNTMNANGEARLVCISRQESFTELSKEHAGDISHTQCFVLKSVLAISLRSMICMNTSLVAGHDKVNLRFLWSAVNHPLHILMWDISIIFLFVNTAFLFVLWMHSWVW